LTGGERGFYDGGVTGATPMNILAQSDSGLWVWLGALVVLLLGLFPVVWWVRRRLSPHEDFHGEGFTLGDMRRLHKAGQLSDEEFDRAKEALIASAQAAARRKEEEKKNLRDLGRSTP
jgi:hypothetical protein